MPPYGQNLGLRIGRTLHPFERLAAIAEGSCPWSAVPAAFGVDGYVCRYERHMIYWKLLADRAVVIVTALHERTHQIDRFKDDFGS
jgi:toxin ParE1/3/4